MADPRGLNASATAVKQNARRLARALTEFSDDFRSAVLDFEDLGESQPGDAANDLQQQAAIFNQRVEAWIDALSEQHSRMGDLAGRLRSGRGG